MPIQDRIGALNMNTLKKPRTVKPQTEYISRIYNSFKNKLILNLRTKSNQGT